MYKSGNATRKAKPDCYTNRFPLIALHFSFGTKLFSGVSETDHSDMSVGNDKKENVDSSCDILNDDVHGQNETGSALESVSDSSWYYEDRFESPSLATYIPVQRINCPYIAQHMKEGLDKVIVTVPVERLSNHFDR